MQAAVVLSETRFFASLRTLTYTVGVRNDKTQFIDAHHRCVESLQVYCGLGPLLGGCQSLAIARFEIAAFAAMTLKAGVLDTHTNVSP